MLLSDSNPTRAKSCQVVIYMMPETKERLKRVAKKRGVQVQTLLRAAIYGWLVSEERIAAPKGA